MKTLIAQTTERLFAPLAVGLGVLLWLRGHNALGDGFLAAGLVGLAILFRHLTRGAGPLQRLAERGVGSVVGAGILLMFGTGCAGFLWSDGFLRAASVHWELPVLGAVTISTALLFELGAAVVVVGVLVAVVERLGEEVQ